MIKLNYPTNLNLTKGNKMSDQDKKKGLFGKAVDAFSNRDEKEEVEKLQAELEKAQKEAAAAKEAMKSLMNKNVSDKTGSNKEIEEADKKIEELENKLKSLMNKDRSRTAADQRKFIEERREKIAAAKKPALIATHTVASGETLSHVALKYYKHATPPYWKYLLEHNDEVLKGSEKNVRTGMELEIPELPEELKD